ncbi:F-type H+-transporting ATPase subunit gamma [Sinosporangium album]|uniref:ATP synthase gamma chain n=1 Tax=Sinosporangium album TaxID=504805 RepID=A0A1G7XGM7_9ACTN|nr:F0F1 ATP synthase subunit gamma [Sinosporangium album]SDG83251.1 F-type H+-transporting ATPase subunit gamma [Sinosporangium album]
MGARLRVIRGRIRSIRSTAKITRAQQLIATSRVSKARERAAAAEPYAREITRAVSTLVTHHTALDHPILDMRPDTSRVAVLALTSDRGFCGAFNHDVIRQTEAVGGLLRDQGKEPVFYVTGRRGAEWFRFRGRETVREWSGFSGEPHYPVASEVGQTLLDAFATPTREGGVGEVHIIYNQFISMLTQKVTAHRILPIEIEERVRPVAEGALPEAPFDFEPSADAVLDALLRTYVRSRVWFMMLSSAAAEHAARRTAMTAATENALELIEQLTRQANEARQEEITTEISEIVGGAAGLHDLSTT